MSYYIKVMEEKKIFEIPESNLARLKEKLEKLEKRANKLHVPSPIFTIIGEKMVPISEEGFRKVFIVTVEGQRPIIAGWEFIAVLQHLQDNGETINIVRAVPNTGEIPVEYRTRGAQCDHCKQDRRRIDTYLVRDIETGKIKQVGSTCLKDFTGHENPEAIAEMAEILIEAYADAEASEFFGGEFGNGERYIDAEIILSTTIVAIEKLGWISRSKARLEECVATADTVWDLIHPPRGNMFKELNVRRPERIDEEEAKKILGWVQNGMGKAVDELDDYEANLYASLKSGVVSSRTVGLASSAVPYYNRHIQKEIQKVKLNGSKFFGTKNKRVDLTVTILGISTISGFYGSIDIYRMLTSEGNLAVWFCTGNCNMKQKEIWKIKGTVKEHKEYKGIQETVLTRVKAVEHAMVS